MSSAIPAIRIGILLVGASGCHRAGHARLCRYIGQGGPWLIKAKKNA